ncbi:MAG: DUF4288 domain-containing protein [Verrucomicrobiota bacterium]
MLRTYHPLQPSSEGNYLVGVIESTFHKETGRRVSVHQNTILIHAVNPRKALEEGLRIASRCDIEYCGEDGEFYRVEFSGITHLGPIHGELESGTEVAWLDLSGIDDAALEERIMGSTVEEAYAAFDAVTEEDSDYPPHVKIPDST